MRAMPQTADKLAAARESLARRLDFNEFLAKLAPKDRLNAERRVQVLETEPDSSRAGLWRRLVCGLMTLAPHAAKFVGKQTVQFYVADGKYRKQVFAMEDLQDGTFTLYSPDVLAEAIKAGVLSPARPAEPVVAAASGAAQAGGQLYGVRASNEPLRIESLDGNSLNPGAHFKDLTGWNRKALRIMLPPSSSPAQVEAAELLCALAAQHFVSSPAPIAAPGRPR